jgi:hypothetical protein
MLLQLALTVELGQLLEIKNPQTQEELMCRVLGSILFGLHLFPGQICPFARHSSPIEIYVLHRQIPMRIENLETPLFFFLKRFLIRIELFG